jgi:amino acid transporter
MIIASTLTSILIATNYSRGLVELFTFTILLATLSALIPYVFASLAGFILQRKDPRMRMSAGASTIAALAFGYSLWAIGGAGAEVVYWGFLLLLAGLPVYVWLGKR